MKSTRLRETTKKRGDDSLLEGHDDVTADEEILRKQLRRAKKMAKHLEKLGLDENGEELDNFSLAKYPVREMKFTIPGMSDQVAINPVVTAISIVCLWSAVIWCSADTATALVKLAEWRSILSLNFTWLIQGSKAVYFFFVLYILYKYGHIHLGNKNDKPDFSTVTYATMVFTAGSGNAMLIYAVSEPLSHRMYHFYAQAGYRTQDEVDLQALVITCLDWGFAGWCPYSIVAIAMSLAVYRYNLPMCYRSAFFPILGHYTWGWIGDVIDGLAIVMTLLGVSTSLGLASMNIVAGFVSLGWIDGDSAENNVAAIENTIIWVLTVISLVSVTSGLHGGVKYLCILAMTMACLLMFFVLVLDDTKFLLNLQVQAVGYYLQTSILQLNFWTDAFGQLREGSGRAVDGKASEPWWMESWLNYVMAWWIVAAAVMGHFICSISRGRKLWEVIFYSLVAPSVFCLIWFCVWGGIGLRQLRQAMELKVLGETHFNNSAHFLAEGSLFCYDVPQEDISIGDQVVFTNHLPGVSPVCEFDEEDQNSAIFNVLDSFSLGNGSSLGQVLSFLFMLASAIFYMTGAGSAALFADKLASSGRKNNHLARRMFWIVTVGALATALLTSGGGNAVSIVQAAMILCGPPCAILVSYLMQSVMILCEAANQRKRDGDYKFPDQPEFAMPIYGGVFNAMEYVFSLGKVDPVRVEAGMHKPTHFQVVECLKGICIPFVSLHQILRDTYPSNPKTNTVMTTMYAACYIGWIAMFIASFTHPGARGYMWTLFMAKGCLLVMIRSDFRARYNIRSNAVGDVVSSLFFWPQVLAQMRLQCVSLTTSERLSGNTVVKIEV